MKNQTVNLIAIVFTAALLITAYFLGLFVDLTGDAGKYGAIARHIVESGDWINLKIHGEAYDQKPPLLFWLAALGFKIGGLHNWSFKIFPILYSFAGFYFTYKLGETLYNKKTGLLAAIMLASSWVYFMFTMDVHTDLILQANVTLAIWQLAAYEKNKKAIHFIFAFIGVGLAMMTKGPIGAAIPAFALLSHLLLKRDFKELFHPKWLLGAGIAFIVCIPAFIGLYNQFGMNGIKFFFFTNNVGRITGSYAGDNNDYFFYLHTLLYLILPWSLLFIFGFFQEFRSYFRGTDKRREFFTIGGIWVFFLIASIAKGKAPHYIFLLIPMILVITAGWVNRFMEGPQHKIVPKLLRVQLFIPVFLIVFSIVIMSYMFPTKNISYWILLSITITAFVLMQTFLKSTTLKLILPSVMTMSMLIIVLNGHALPMAFDYQASTKASKIYNENARNEAPFYNYLYPQYEVFFYGSSNAKRLYTIDEFQPDPQETWIFTTESGKDTINMRYPENIAKIYPFAHRGMSNLSPQFMNPATRQQSLDPMFLIQLKPTDELYLSQSNTYK